MVTSTPSVLSGAIFLLINAIGHSEYVFSLCGGLAYPMLRKARLHERLNVSLIGRHAPCRVTKDLIVVFYTMRVATSTKSVYEMLGRVLHLSIVNAV